MKLLGCLGCFAALTACPFYARGQLTERHDFTGLSISVPDNNEFGVEDHRTITSAITAIGDVNVNLSISGEFNGDLYATLTHDSGFSVLLNRVGRRAASGLEQFGYGDPGFNINFDDSASRGDIHGYRLTLNGSHTVPLTSALTESWAPDARTTDPANVLAEHNRSALLSSFNNLNANGTWTLFLSDFAQDGHSTVTGWGLQLTAVPEPETYALVVGLLCLGGAILKKQLRSVSRLVPAPTAKAELT